MWKIGSLIFARKLLKDGQDGEGAIQGNWQHQANVKTAVPIMRLMLGSIFMFTLVFFFKFIDPKSALECQVLMIFGANQAFVWRLHCFTAKTHLELLCLYWVVYWIEGWYNSYHNFIACGHKFEMIWFCFRVLVLCIRAVALVVWDR